MNQPLNPEQVQNWRKVLCTMLGPYALIMPEGEVSKMRDKFQDQVDKLGLELEKEAKQEGEGL